MAYGNNNWGNRNYGNNRSWGNRNNYGNNSGYVGYQNRGKSNYSESQKRAFRSGQGYRLGQAGKAIVFNNRSNYDSFMNGYKSIDPSRYPDRKSKHK